MYYVLTLLEVLVVLVCIGFGIDHIQTQTAKTLQLLAIGSVLFLLMHFIKKRTKHPQKCDETDVPVGLAAALSTLQEAHYQQALDLAQPYTINPKSIGVLADAHRICALASARLACWDVSFSYWLTLFEKAEPTAFNALQLATTSVMCQQLERGEAWYQKTVELTQHGTDQSLHDVEYVPMIDFISSLQQAHYFHASLPYLEQLKDIYCSLSITDPMFLYSIIDINKLHQATESDIPISNAQAYNKNTGKRKIVIQTNGYTLWNSTKNSAKMAF